MDLTLLKDLIAKQKSFYQDIEIDGQVLAKGTRANCAHRWAMLLPLFLNNKVYLDVGSDLGYFSQRIAWVCPDSVVLSFEANESSAKIQAEIMNVSGLTNVAVCNYKLWIEGLKRLSLAVEMIDTIMFLAVLHHYEADEQREVLELCSKMIPEIIIEYVIQVGPGKWGGKAYLDFEKELPNYYQHIATVGTSHSGPSEKRVIIRAWNDKIIREGLDGTVSGEEKEVASAPNHKLFWTDGKWILASKVMTENHTYPNVHHHLITGVNCHNILWFNSIWPTTEWFQEQARAAYNRLLGRNLKISNIHIPNLIFSSSGLQAIEYIRYGANYSLETAKQDIEKVVETFKTRKPYV